MSATSPQLIAPEVHLVRCPPTEDGSGLPRNSLVLGGADPVLLGTGPADDRARWWDQVEAVVDPGAVRWVFLAVDAPDHIGGLGAVLQRCPAAQVVAGRELSGRLDVDPARTTWLDDGPGTLGGRPVVLVRPPVYASPATRGFYDVRSRVYWAGDGFGLRLPHPVRDVSQLDRDVWDRGASRYHRQLGPWVTQVDPSRFRREVAKVAALDLHALVSAHGPVIGRHDIGHALDQLADLPGLPEVAPDATATTTVTGPTGPTPHACTQHP